MGNILHSGHYIAYVRRRPNRQHAAKHSRSSKDWVYDSTAANDGMWFRTSDLSVTECCYQGFGNVEKSEAYMLFYELLPPSATTL